MGCNDVENSVIIDKKRMEGWHVRSSGDKGMHHCVSPGEQDCKTVNIFRLNLGKQEEYELLSGSLEMDAVLLAGSAEVESACFPEKRMEKLDSFYIPGNCSVRIKAEEDAVFYIGAAVCEGYGKSFFRRFQKDLPLGEIHQIHGSGSGEREVCFTLNPEMEASRLLCGLTWGNDGAWTSWPPHQHEKYLEEVYCYFDMEPPKFGLHISYLKSGQTEGIVTHTVSSGSMVLAPVGYHPTVAAPGTRNTYFWVLAAHSHESRRYDLAENDPVYQNT